MDIWNEEQVLNKKNIKETNDAAIHEIMWAQASVFAQYPYFMWHLHMTKHTHTYMHIYTKIYSNTLDSIFRGAI